jgi:hypothetical protein
MIEKSKNGQKRKNSHHTIFGFLLLSIFAFIGLVIAVSIESGRGSAEYCLHPSAVYPDFEVAGRIVDSKGQGIDQANVELGNVSAVSCIDDIISYSTVTNENGEFSFGPILFAYTADFSISVSAKGCRPSVAYDDLPSTKTVTIILDCIPASTK